MLVGVRGRRRLRAGRWPAGCGARGAPVAPARWPARWRSAGGRGLVVLPASPDGRDLRRGWPRSWAGRCCGRRPVHAGRGRGDLARRPAVRAGRGGRAGRGHPAAGRRGALEPAAESQPTQVSALSLVAAGSQPGRRGVEVLEPDPGRWTWPRPAGRGRRRGSGAGRRGRCGRDAAAGRRRRRARRAAGPPGWPPTRAGSATSARSAPPG